MYYGKITPELKKIQAEYEKKFGYDPNGDMELELGDEDYEEYINSLQKAIDTGKSFHYFLEGAMYWKGEDGDVYDSK